MINHHFRCIYVHIPKTAGNSVNRAFGVHWQDHKDLRRYAAELVPDVFNHYYKFAIVRNPWERLLSDYNYQKKKSRPASSKLFLFDERGKKRSFRAWVAAVLTDPHGCSPQSWGADVSADIHRWSPQVDWIALDGRIAVDRVVRLDQLQHEFPAICRAIGRAPCTLGLRNRRFHLHYSWYYDQPTCELVRNYYRKDVEAFRFCFEDAPPQAIRFAAHRLFNRALRFCSTVPVRS